MMRLRQPDLVRKPVSNRPTIGLSRQLVVPRTTVSQLSRLAPCNLLKRGERLLCILAFFSRNLTVFGALFETTKEFLPIGRQKSGIRIKRNRGYQKNGFGRRSLDE